MKRLIKVYVLSLILGELYRVTFNSSFWTWLFYSTSFERSERGKTEGLDVPEFFIIELISV
jgi:hypothetical protein